MDDFNSHSPNLGYDDLHKGDEVADWIITRNMVLINKANDPNILLQSLENNELSRSGHRYR